MAALQTCATDAQLQAHIQTARQRSLHWYARMQMPGAPHGVSRISALHDAQQWPGMLLPGTYNAIMGRALLGDLANWSTQHKHDLAQWLITMRQPSGVFRVPGMHDADVFKKPELAETWGYIDFHVSNYSLGALEFLSADAMPNYQILLSFAEPFLDRDFLAQWLAMRDMRDPWLEGNNIVNLGSFLLEMARTQTDKAARVQAVMQDLFAWHDASQEPSTGFWGVDQLQNPTKLLHAMAGSMHNYHLWYVTGRPLPHQDKAVDYSLTQPARVHSACIDVDLVDLLVHAYWQIDHRRTDIEHWLRTLLPELLAFQNADGGFADVPDGPDVPPRGQDGWVRGYAEPQGHSNTFATWFRWIAIAMIARCLWPQWEPFADGSASGLKGGWQFRRMPGIGFCKAPL